MEFQKGKTWKHGWKKQKQKKDNKRNNNVKTPDTQPLYEFFKFKIHSNSNCLPSSGCAFKDSRAIYIDLDSRDSRASKVLCSRVRLEGRLSRPGRMQSTHQSCSGPACPFPSCFFCCFFTFCFLPGRKVKKATKTQKKANNKQTRSKQKAKKKQTSESKKQKREFPISSILLLTSSFLLRTSAVFPCAPCALPLLLVLPKAFFQQVVPDSSFSWLLDSSPGFHFLKIFEYAHCLPFCSSLLLLVFTVCCFLFHVGT